MPCLFLSAADALTRIPSVAVRYQLLEELSSDIPQLYTGMKRMACGRAIIGTVRLHVITTNSITPGTPGRDLAGNEICL